MSAQRRRPLAAALAGAVVLVAAAAGMLASRRDEPTRHSFDEAVTQITAFVERERGLTFNHRPTIVVAGEEGLARRVHEETDKNKGIRVKEADLHLTLGILSPDVDMIKQVDAAQSVGVQSVYDAETGEVVLKNTSLTPYTRATLAHELTHALDNQHFGLHRPKLADARDGSGFGLLALGEGNARRVEFAYRATLPAAEQQQDYAQRAALEAHTASAGVHPYLGLYFGAAYEYGLALVHAILNYGGQQALDEAFRSPPTTHEQVLFPKRYLDREQTRPVKAPTADGPVTDTGVIGDVKLGVMLGDGPGQGPAAGWGGDRYVLWRDHGGQRACVRARVVGDAPEDTTALAAALRRWAHQQPQASMRITDSQVEFTACNIRNGRPAWTGPDSPGTVDHCPHTPLAGFGKAQATITHPNGATVTRCLHLADTPRRAQRGLMEVTDTTLGGYDGMLFMYPSDTTDPFWMRNTPMPLSIAYLDSLGHIVSTANMQPCADRPDCPTYAPRGPYRYTVEVPRGRLANFGLVAGATLHIDGIRPGYD